MWMYLLSTNPLNRATLHSVGCIKKMVMNPKNMLVIGFLLVLFGFLGPMLMVLGVLESTFLLNFVSYGASIGGLFLGIIGTAWYSRTKRR
jgi:hypothetical protein